MQPLVIVFPGTALELAQQLGQVQLHRSPQREGLGKGDQRHDEIAVCLVQLLPGVLQDAIGTADHRRLPVELAPASGDRGNETGPVQVVREGSYIETWQKHLFGSLGVPMLDAFERLLCADFQPFNDALGFSTGLGMLISSHVRLSGSRLWSGACQGASLVMHRISYAISGQW